MRHSYVIGIAILIFLVNIPNAFAQNKTGEIKSAENVTHVTDGLVLENNGIGQPWTFWFALAGAIGNGATALALYFVYRQSRHTQEQTRQAQEQTRQAQEQTRQAQEQTTLTREEMENTLRPWLGVSKIERVDSNTVDYLIRNYGRIPAKIVKIVFLFGRNDKISQTELRSSPYLEDTNLIVFPSSDIPYTLRSYTNQFEYLGIIIHYEFSKNKRGEYGRISYFTDEGSITLEIFAS